MIKRILVFFCAISFINCQSAPQVDDTSKDILRKQQQESLTHKIAHLQKQNDLPAMQAIVVNHSEPEFYYSAGTRAMGLDMPLQTNDLFALGTLRHTFTTLLVAQLIDQKIIHWSTTLGSIDKDQKMHSSLKNITIDMLLSHRDGLSDIQKLKVWPTLFDKKISKKRSQELMVNAILNHSAQFSAGSKFSFNDSGFIILQWILETLTNFSWEELVRNKILNHLGMASCEFHIDLKTNAKTATQPWPHIVKNGKIILINPNNSTQDSRSSEELFGNIYCSSDDLIKFLNELNYGLFKESTFVKEETFAKLFSETEQKGVTYANFSLSQKIWAGGNVYTQIGNSEGGLALVVLAPHREMSLIVLTNINSPAATQNALQVLKYLTEYVQQ